MLLDKQLTKEEQKEVLETILGFGVHDDVIIDDNGFDFYGYTENADYDLTTLKGIFKYSSDSKYKIGKQAGRTEKASEIRYALDIVDNY